MTDITNPIQPSIDASPDSSPRQDPHPSPPPAAAHSSAPPQGSQSSHSHSGGQRSNGPGGPGGSGGPAGPGGRPGGPRRGKRQYTRKKKVCRFCTDKVDFIDYKTVEVLQPFIQDRGKILPRRMTGTCARHQRWLTVAIKRARNIALLPFATEL